MASYKFALAKSILTLAESGETAAGLEELAVPFSRELCGHLEQVDTQSTSAGSRFLDACRYYNADELLPRDTVDGCLGTSFVARESPAERVSTEAPSLT